MNDLGPELKKYGQFCVAIGGAANAESYGEIVFATEEGAELRLLVDGAISINGEHLGFDSEVYECFRNLFGQPLPDLPATHKGEAAFHPLKESLPRAITRVGIAMPPGLTDSILIGDYLPDGSESGSIVFRSLEGKFFVISHEGWTSGVPGGERIKVGERKPEVMAALRLLMALPLVVPGEVAS